MVAKEGGCLEKRLFGKEWLLRKSVLKEGFLSKPRAVGFRWWFLGKTIAKESGW